MRTSTTVAVAVGDVSSLVVVDVVVGAFVDVGEGTLVDMQTTRSFSST